MGVRDGLDDRESEPGRAGLARARAVRPGEALEQHRQHGRVDARPLVRHGDDGAAGALAAALPYTGRLARRAGELVQVGDLRALEALGTRRLTVGVTWTPAGEGTYRAVLAPAEALTREVVA